MSYACSGAVQSAVFQTLSSDATLAGLVGSAVFDAAPSGPAPELHVILGDEDVRDRSDKSGGMAEHRITVSVVSDAAGYLVAKEVAGAISDALIDRQPALSRGRIVSLGFLRARARRLRAGQVRRIDLVFRALVEDD